MRLRRHLSGRVAGSLFALVLGAIGSSRVAAATQTTPLPPMPQVAQDVTSPTVHVRRQALKALRERGGPETLPLLAPLLSDSELDIREGAIAGVIAVYVQPTAKRSVGNAADAFELARFHAQPWSVPPELSGPLVRALADEEPSVRRDAAYAVGIVLPPPATEAVAFELVASLSDRDPSVRIAAALALGRLQVQDAGVALIGRINDENLDVRLASMRALGDLRYKGAVHALTDQFEFYVRGIAGRAAIAALGAIGDSASLGVFQSQITSGYPAHRKAAYEGLARSGQARASWPRIEEAMGSEKDARVLTAMAFALASAGHGDVNRVLDALSDRDRVDDALTYLVELGQSHAPAVAARMSDANPIVREQVATALGFIGGPDAAAALKAASGESDPHVRHAIDVAQVRLTRGAAISTAGGSN